MSEKFCQLIKLYSLYKMTSWTYGMSHLFCPINDIKFKKIKILYINELHVLNVR